MTMTAPYSLKIDRRIHTVEKILLRLFELNDEKNDDILPDELRALFDQMKKDHTETLADIEKHEGQKALNYLAGANPI